MLLFKNGLLWDGLGNDPVKSDILIKDGVIAEIAPFIDCPEAEIRDVEGYMVLPGFVDALNAYGGRGPGLRENGLAELTDPVQPELSVIYAVDHDGINFQELYTYGVTVSGVAPSAANVLAGKASVFYTYGRNPYAMLLKEEAASIAAVSGATKKPYAARNQAPMTRMGSFSLLREALAKAQRYEREKTGYDAKCEALLPVLSGEMPLFVSCSTRSEMKGVIHLLKEFPAVKPVLTGAFALDESFEEVADGRIPVLLGDLTDAFAPYNANVNFAAVKDLLEKGAVIACSCCADGMPASGKETLLWNGIQWHKHGIEANQVLKAMTSTPAELLGVGDLTGSLQVGKNADLAVWTANPIKTYRAQLKAVYVKGEDLLKKERYASCW